MPPEAGDSEIVDFLPSQRKFTFLDAAGLQGRKLNSLEGKALNISDTCEVRTVVNLPEENSRLWLLVTNLAQPLRSIPT